MQAKLTGTEAYPQLMEISMAVVNCSRTRSVACRPRYATNRRKPRRTHRTDNATARRSGARVTLLYRRTRQEMPAIAADIEDAVHGMLAKAGYHHYETSAHARPGSECRHNLNYWRFGDYLGIGAGAHGKLSFSHRVLRQVRWRDPARTIEILSLGKGHTRGDLVVWLPQEGILASGDLVYAVSGTGSLEAYQIVTVASRIDGVIEARGHLTFPLAEDPGFGMETEARAPRASARSQG